MNTGILITGVAIAALVAGGASATVHKKLHASHATSGSMYAPPAQPIPYAQLDTYLHSTPSQRASMEMSSGATPQSEATSGAMTSTATPNPSAGDQISGSSAAPPASMSPPADPNQTPAGSPAAPSDSSSTPPK